ncbi:MAG TPA: response regulator transcription factor [Acidobacteriaceae bacterium]|jgi:DNA-binding NarL/FixJ family response regulator|nr:response regulator transcription factor [Acidobacteriaceae bacterium]
MTRAAAAEAETDKKSTPPAHIRVILADSQAIYRVGLRKVFALEGDMEVVGQAESLETLREVVETTPADVVVLEAGLISAPATMLPELVRLAPEIKMIVQVLEIDEATTVELYRRGVRGVIPRSISPDLLLKCVRKIAAGETWIDNRSVSWVIEAYRTNGAGGAQGKAQPKLSPKELTIIGCISKGMRNREIADQIGTTEQVIKNYLRKVYDKLGVSDRLELALYCIQNQLVPKSGSPTPAPATKRKA